MIDENNYVINTPVESLEEYGDGGLYPIHIGDHFQNGRYEVLNKLGFGGYSTVWAAWDDYNKSNVSLKTIRSEHSESNRELHILQRIQQDTQHPGYKYLPRLLDYFYEGSTEGSTKGSTEDSAGRKHLFLVLELLGPKLSTVISHLPNHRFNLSFSCRRVSRQLLLAVDCLHSHGIVHGDIHEGNILFRLPNNHTLDLTTVCQDKISRKDGAPLEKGLPRFLVEPLDFDDQSIDFEALDQIQLIDFSSSFFNSEPLDLIHTPVHMSPPEFIFRRPLDQKIDIWNIACTTFYVATGRPLFFALSDNRLLLPQIYKATGDSFAHWFLSAIFKAQHDGVWKDLPAIRGSRIEDHQTLEEALSLYHDNVQTGTSNTEKKYLGALRGYLRKILIPDPSKRPSVKELQAEDWVQIVID